MALELRRQKRRMLGSYQEHILEIYACADAEVEAQAAALSTQTRPGTLTAIPALCREVDYEKRAWPDGDARIVVSFRTPTWSEWLESHVNKAIAFKVPAYTAFPRRWDLQGRLMEGISESDLYYSWMITDGENMNMRPKSGIIVRAIVDNHSTFIKPFDDGRIGNVNDTDCLNINEVGYTGKLLYLGCSDHKIIPGMDPQLEEVSWHFLMHSLVWNEQCLCKEYSIEDNWTFVSLMRYVRGRKVTFTGEQFYAQLGVESSFSVIDSACDHTGV